jgi:hypothetical protein
VCVCLSVYLYVWLSVCLSVSEWLQTAAQLAEPTSLYRTGTTNGLATLLATHRG